MGSQSDWPLVEHSTLPWATPDCAACDGHHGMSDLGAAGEPVHSGGETVAPVWLHRAIGWVRSPGLMEKIMSKTTMHNERVMTMATGELRDHELDGVTGGLVVIAIIAILFGQLLPVVNPPPVNPPKAS
jgi:hypothetical protein